MTDRILPPSEWQRLASTEADLGQVYASLNPHTTQIAVVENDQGEIVACWSVSTLVHVEGAWIRADLRKTSRVTVRLYRRVKAIVKSLGASGVLTGAASPDVCALLDRKSARPVPQEYLLCL